MKYVTNDGNKYHLNKMALMQISGDGSNVILANKEAFFYEDAMALIMTQAGKRIWLESSQMGENQKIRIGFEKNSSQLLLEGLDEANIRLVIAFFRDEEGVGLFVMHFSEDKISAYVKNVNEFEARNLRNLFELLCNIAAGKADDERKQLTERRG